MYLDSSLFSLRCARPRPIDAPDSLLVLAPALSLKRRRKRREGDGCGRGEEEERPLHFREKGLR